MLLVILFRMIAKKKLQNLYYQMLRIRKVEEAIADEYGKKQMRCPTHLCIGQEAIAAGVCANLKSKDIVFSGHRSHGHYLAKGGSLKRMLAELYGKATGCAKGRGGSQHLIDLSANFWGATPIVGETIPVAVGTALATAMSGKDHITAVFFGDAAMEEGVTHESLNYAALKKLPVLFICENNLYSTYTHISERQPERSISSLAAGHGIKVAREDGNNVLRVYKTAKAAIEAIGNGDGPFFIEYLTYRLREHVGPLFDPAGFRPRDEYEYWLERSPIGHLEKYVLKNNILSKNDLKAQERKIKMEIDEAFKFAKASPYPDEEISEKMVYAQ